MNLRTPSRKAIVLMNLMLLAALATWFASGQNGFFFLPKSVLMMTQQNATSGTNSSGIASIINALSGLSSSSSSSSASSNQLSSSMQNNKSGGQICQFTNVDAFDPKIMKKAIKYPPMNCSKGRPWLVYTNGTHLKVNVSKVKENQKAENFSYCRYRTLTKGTKNDNQLFTGQWSKHFNDSISIVDGAVFIEAECYDESNKDIASSYLSNIVLKHETQSDSHISRYVDHLKQFAPKETLSVLLVGIDGLSKQNMERSMPETRKYLLRDLGAVELEKYNKVGLNTFPNVLPMLTGHNAGFFKRSMNWTTKMPFDKIADYFVWKEFGNAGYRTALDLEETYITAFHYLKKGFYKSPVDFYTRAMTIAARKNKKLNTEGKFCKGDKPGISVNNDFLMELATSFNDSNNPYFAFSFLTRLTHDDQNRVSSGDHLYLKFIKTLKKRHALENTVLIFFSDHGERFGSIRHTYNGIIESKSPVGFIALPDWFKSKYPTEFSLFQKNTGRLTTTFDIHATLRDILYFKSASPPPNLFPGPGISYFQKLIPENRTCAEAGIPIEYCNCNSLTKVKLDETTTKQLSTAVTDAMMNELGTLIKDKCHTIVPKSVQSILKKDRPKDRIKKILSQFSVFYQINIATTPGHGVFEAVVDLNSKTKKASVVGSISRLDMYKGEKDCVSDPRIRPFCFCK